MVIRVLPEQSERVETGPLRFGTDWPGLFIRGDDAGRHAWSLHCILERSDLEVNPIERIQLTALHNLLVAAIDGPAKKMFDLDDATN